MSRPPNSAWCRLNDSLAIRLIKFLVVALRQCFFDIARPSLARTMPLSREITVNHLSRLRFAFSNTRPYAAAVNNRFSRRNRFALLRALSFSNPGFGGAGLSPGRVLRRQFSAALGAAALQDETACLGRHTGAEAMRACALQFAGLIRTFHLPATCISGGHKPPTCQRGGKVTLDPRQCQ